MALQCAGCLLFLGLSLVLAASDEDLNPPSVEDLHPPSGEEWEGQPLKLPLKSWEDPAEQEPCFGEPCFGEPCFGEPCFAASVEDLHRPSGEEWEGHLPLESWQDPDEPSCGHPPCGAFAGAGDLVVLFVTAALAALAALYTIVLGILGLLWMVGVNTVPFMQGVLALAGVKALFLVSAVYSLF